MLKYREDAQDGNSNIQEDDDDEGEEDNDDDDDDNEDEDGMREAQQHDLTVLPGASIIRRGFRCHICSKIFKRSSHLNQHMKVHCTDKSFQCPECSKLFSSALVLRSHVRTHSGLKAYMCSLCSAGFSTPMALRRHMVQHNNNAKSYVCELCNERFKNSAQLRRHWILKDCHGEVTLFSCPFCMTCLYLLYVIWSDICHVLHSLSCTLLSCVMFAFFLHVMNYTITVNLSAKTWLIQKFDLS